jgi:hypothetical protein
MPSRQLSTRRRRLPRIRKTQVMITAMACGAVLTVTLALITLVDHVQEMSQLAATSAAGPPRTAGINNFYSFPNRSYIVITRHQESQ